MVNGKISGVNYGKSRNRYGKHISSHCDREYDIGSGKICSISD
jgi:hypothetical protein